MQGTLERTPLPAVLHQLFKSGATGCLRFPTPSGEHLLFVREGFVTAVKLSGAIDTLGRLLVEMRLIDIQKHRLLAVESRVKNVPYEELVMQLGLLTVDKLRVGMRADLRQSLHRLFFLSGGAYQFTPGA